VQLVAVEGHTDSRGSLTRNQSLSKRRAEAVVAWLAQRGITVDRMQAWGCGPNRPLESNDTEAGRQTNRRVEFHILVPPPEQPHDPRGCERAGKPRAR
jgi:outer membrane protein OmpA-like peptidoglycan-associated protein